MPLTLPNNIVNGQAIDATPVMANFNALAGVAAVGGAVAAASGANADITSLSGLSTPLSQAQGGTGGNIATTPLAAAVGGTGDAGTAWTAYTGTMTVSGGSGGAGTFSGRWKRLGKTVFFSGVAICTAIGTGNSNILLNGLPFNFATGGAAASRETAVNGFVVSLSWSAGGTGISLAKYDNSFPATANGCTWPFSICVETT